LIKKNKGDKDLVREGLLDLYDRVEGGSGPWSIIPEVKKSKIMRHIDGLDL